MKSLPKLYKTTGVGRTQTWQIFIDGSQTYTRFGPEGGVIQESAREQSVGKNAGKANGTTPAQQAQLDAESKWRKKLGSGYVQTLAELKAGTVDASVEGGIWPMLAKRYKDSSHKIVFPAAVQPKLDGHRCVCVIDKAGKATLWSRKRKPITGMPHVIEAVEALGLKDYVLDGELFSDEIPFETIAHFVRKPDAQEGGENIEYRVFDMQSDGDFEVRARWLELAFEHAKFPLLLVPHIVAKDEAEVMEYFDQCIAEGHEGCMVRNLAGGYDSHPTHRSDNLQKVKAMEDAEFKIVGVKEGKGKLAGKAIFTCVTDAGTEFDVKMKGAIADLAKYFDNPKLALGKQLTVQYQNMTDKSGVPRFPVGLRLRED